MYDINMVTMLVTEALYAESDYYEFCRKTREKLGLSSKSEIWIPSLDGSTAHRLGELSEKSSQKWDSVASICSLLEIDQDRLISAVKSITRREKNHGRYDVVIHINQYNDIGWRLAQFLHDDDSSQYYKNTGRIKAWCKENQN